MTIVDTLYQDRQSNKPIKSQLRRVCLDCGNNAALRRDGWRCNSCLSYNIGDVWENMLDTFRRGLAEKQHPVIVEDRQQDYKTDPARTFGNVRFIASAAWAERWTGDPEQIKEHFPAVGDVEIKQEKE